MLMRWSGLTSTVVVYFSADVRSSRLLRLLRPSRFQGFRPGHHASSLDLANKILINLPVAVKPRLVCGFVDTSLNFLPRSTVRKKKPGRSVICNITNDRTLLSPSEVAKHPVTELRVYTGVALCIV